MFKLSVLLFAAVAVQAILTISTDDSWQRQQNHIRVMAMKIRKDCDDVANAIQNVQADTPEGKRSLMEEAKDFSHNIREVLYKMEAVKQYTTVADRDKISEISQHLSETAYSIQQAMNSEPNQIKNLLKEQVQNVATSAKAWSDYLQQAPTPQREQDNNMRSMKRAMMNLHIAIKTLQVQVRNHDKNTQEVSSKMQELANQMNTYTQNVQDDDDEAVCHLVDYVQPMSLHMINMAGNIEQEAYGLQQGQTRSTLFEWASRITHMREDLEKASEPQCNTRQRARELKQQIEKVMREAATEMEKLKEIAQQSDDQEGRGIKAVAKNVMDEGIAVAEATQAQLTMMKE